MTRYIDELKSVLEFFETPSTAMYITKMINVIIEADFIYLIGNGGSCATAEHFAVDLTKMCNKRAMALTSSSLITMAGNDYGYEASFIWFLEKHARKEDLVIAFSTSGTSPNIVKAVNSEDVVCKKIVITGMRGMGSFPDLDIMHVCFPTQQTQILEDMNSILCHQLALLLKEKKEIY